MFLWPLVMQRPNHGFNDNQNVSYRLLDGMRPLRDLGSLRRVSECVHVWEQQFSIRTAASNHMHVHGDGIDEGARMLGGLLANELML